MRNWYIAISLTLAVFVTVGCGEAETSADVSSVVSPAGAVLGACYSAEHCGPGTVCARFDSEESAGSCYRACHTADGSSDCPLGSVCSPIRDGVASAPTGELPPDGACVPLVDEPGEVWSTCTTSRDCRDGLHCTQLPGSENAHCVAFCDEASNCEPLSDETSCSLSLQRTDGSELRACASQCETQEDCRGVAQCASFGEFSLCVR